MIDIIDSIYTQISLNVTPEMANVTCTPLAATLLEAKCVMMDGFLCVGGCFDKRVLY